MKLIFSQTITLANAQPLKITLGEDTQVLDEVVVTALGIKRATKALSYNVQEVKGDELTAVKDANFMNSLSGKVAGVQINSGATGAGGATRVVMRGMKSLTKDNNALYVIDGVPIFNTGKSGGEGLFGEMGGSDAVADLNPDDIASISMMTGPSAAALYGSAAANGVVLITTKKGQTEKTTIQYPTVLLSLKHILCRICRTVMVQVPDYSAGENWQTVDITHLTSLKQDPMLSIR